jgi:hypothetical protein
LSRWKLVHYTFLQRSLGGHAVRKHDFDFSKAVAARRTTKMTHSFFKTSGKIKILLSNNVASEGSLENNTNAQMMKRDSFYFMLFD